MTNWSVDLCWPISANIHTHWDNAWKSRGVIMVSGVLREVTRPKPKGTPFPMISPRLFHTFSFFCHLGLVKRDFFLPMASLGTNIGRLKYRYTSPGYRKDLGSSVSHMQYFFTGSALFAGSVLTLTVILCENIFKAQFLPNRKS